MEYFDGIDFPEGHETYCPCDLCEAVQDAIVKEHRRQRAARGVVVGRISADEAERIREAMILDDIERNG